MKSAIIIDNHPVLKSDDAKSAGSVLGLLIAKNGNNLATVKCSFPEDKESIALDDLKAYYPDNKIAGDDNAVVLREISKGHDLLLEIQDAIAFKLPNNMLFVYPTFEKEMKFEIGLEVTQRGVMTFSNMQETDCKILEFREPGKEKPKDIDSKINNYLEQKFDKKFDKTGRFLGAATLAGGYGLLKILEGTAAVGDVVETTKKTVKGIYAEKKAGTYDKKKGLKARWLEQFKSDKEKGELIFQQTREGRGQSREKSQDFVARIKKMIKGR